MPQVPTCCDTTEWDLLFKIVLQTQSMSGDPSLVPPAADDSMFDLYRKWLLSLALL